MEPVRICIVGVGGYGRSYVTSVETVQEEGLARLMAVVIRNRAKYPEEVAKYESEGVPIFTSFDQALDDLQGKVDIMAIPTGINTHRRLSVPAMKAGYDVVLEKPPAATIQDVDAMLQAEQESGRFCSIGFQSQSKNTVKELKRRVCDGKLGEIKEVAVKGMWKRLDSYYDRNPWAGELKLGDDYVLDGTVNNPLAHYLYNGMYFGCTTWGEVLKPVRVRAELYHAHHIDSEDNSGVEVEAENGVRVFFFATLCAPGHTMPEIEVVGSKGKGHWVAGGNAEVEYADGTKEVIESDDEREHVEVFRNAIRYLRGEDSELNCPLRMTRNFTLTVNGAFESSGGTHTIPDEFLTIAEEEGSVSRTINDIMPTIDRAFAERKLYSDLGVPWAKATEAFCVEGYEQFELS